ncbi:hypothetical protein BDQ17DRAFT_1428720 [Cyathus striatus]|nr:hypothetical protein BDQ17DRAFT_1428720 [Cyathus striatus]
MSLQPSATNGIEIFRLPLPMHSLLYVLRFVLIFITSFNDVKKATEDLSQVKALVKKFSAQRAMCLIIEQAQEASAHQASFPSSTEPTSSSQQANSTKRQSYTLFPPSLALLPLVPTIPTSAKSKNLPVPNPLLTSPLQQDLLRALCKSYTRLADTSKGSEYVSAMGEWCEALLDMTGNDGDVEGLIGRAEMLLRKEECKDAIRVLQKAFEGFGWSDRQIHARLKKAQKLLKQSLQKDYYKILGLSRDANVRDIKMAFRKQAKLAHPDKGVSEAKMAAVNEAYEVLTNPELRARFDAGDDPMDLAA